MQIKDYINKNLPSSVNFNVLSTVYKENGSELTEEVKAYLKETPGNTNWNVFKDLGGGGSSNIVFEGEIDTLILYSSMQDYLTGFNFSNLDSITLPSDTTNIKITINSDVYELPLSSVPTKFFDMDGYSYYVDRYFGSDLRSDSGAPRWIYDVFPCGLICNQIDSNTLELSVLLINTEIGTYSVKIETL